MAFDPRRRAISSFHAVALETFRLIHMVRAALAKQLLPFRSGLGFQLAFLHHHNSNGFKWRVSRQEHSAIAHRVKFPGAHPGHPTTFFHRLISWSRANPSPRLSVDQRHPSLWPSPWPAVARTNPWQRMEITWVILSIHYIIHSREQTCLRLPFQVSTNMSTLYRRFPGECIATFFLHIDPKTANMSQFLQLGPLDFDPDLGYVSYFWGIDSANNPCPPTGIIYDALFRKELGPLSSPPFCYQCGLWFEPYWGLEIKMLGRPGR